jgi:uncharacterized protein
MDLEGVEVLSERECRRLLGEERVGRVAVSVAALPAVFPVNYVVASDEILFFTGEGTKLRAATSNTVVAFEVDHVDPLAERGWSVLVVGKARERSEPGVAAGARKSGLRPWAEGDRHHLVSVTTELLTGRRLGSGSSSGRDGMPITATAGPRSPISTLAGRPVRIEQGRPLREVAQVMREAGVASVLVGHDDAVVTERDLSRALHGGSGPDATAAAVGGTDIVTVEEDATVIDAAAEMIHQEVRHLLVRNHRGQVVGLVSMHDVMRTLLDAADPAVWVMLHETLPAATARRDATRSEPYIV